MPQQYPLTRQQKIDILEYLNNITPSNVTVSTNAADWEHWHGTTPSGMSNCLYSIESMIDSDGMHQVKVMPRTPIRTRVSLETPVSVIIAELIRQVQAL